MIHRGSEVKLVISLEVMLYIEDISHLAFVRAIVAEELNRNLTFEIYKLINAFAVLPREKSAITRQTWEPWFYWFLSSLRPYLRPSPNWEPFGQGPWLGQRTSSHQHSSDIWGNMPMWKEATSPTREHEECNQWQYGIMYQWKKATLQIPMRFYLNATRGILRHHVCDSDASWNRRALDPLNDHRGDTFAKRLTLLN